MTSPVSKDDQFIHILKRLAHRQRRKRKMEEEEEVVFVKKKKKKAKKNTEVIILDESNIKLKEEPVDYVKYEVINNKDLIITMGDKNKGEIHLGKNNNFLKIQNTKSEVVREREMKNKNRDTIDEIDVNLELSIYGKRAREKSNLKKLKENANRIMTMNNENCNKGILNKYEDVKNTNIEAMPKKNEVKNSKKNNSGRRFIDKDIKVESDIIKGDDSNKVNDDTSTVLLEKRKCESKELSIVELLAISVQKVQSKENFEPEDIKHQIWTPKSEENVIKKDKLNKNETEENISYYQKVATGRKLKPADYHVPQSKNVIQDCEHRVFTAKDADNVWRKGKSNKKTLFKDEPEGKLSKHDARIRRKVTTEVTRMKFSLKEDQIILAAMEKYGDSLSMCKLAKNLGRLQDSVTNRVNKLKVGSRDHKHESYTIEEDKFIMDMALDFVEKNGDLNNLECNIPHHQWLDLVKQLTKRLATSLRCRWEYHLKTWILQHRAGTLNLDITRMLANYLADHFQDIASIDWPSVAAKKEFSGHTEGSLRSVFFGALLSYTKKNMKAAGSVVTLRDVAEVTNAIKRRNNRVKEKRQQEVIQYYEKWIERGLL